MTLQRRIQRLEGTTAQPGDLPSAVVLEFMQPSASGPELVGLMLRPLRGGDVTQIDREPEESEAALRARFEAACAP